MPEYSYGRTSRGRLDTVDPRLIRIFEEAIKHRDISIVCGVRSKADQDAAYPKFSKVKWPNSKHNLTPEQEAAGELCKAVDAVPYPTMWSDIAELKELGFFILGIAAGMGIPLTWGSDWDGDHDLDDQTFIDYPHFELKE